MKTAATTNPIFTLWIYIFSETVYNKSKFLCNTGDWLPEITEANSSMQVANSTSLKIIVRSDI